MAKQTNSNLSPATGAEAIYELMLFLRDQLGFTITRSGDGLAAFDDTGTSVITSPGSGANGMANTDAHFTAQDPQGEYEWCFQRNSSNTSWEVVISSLDGFTGGNATTRPTATDEQVLIDGTLFEGDGTYRWHLAGDDVPIGQTVGVYPWVAVGTLNGTGEGHTWIFHEPMLPGSYPELAGTRSAPTTGEPDPSVYMADYSSSPDVKFEFGTSTGGIQDIPGSNWKGWYCMNGVNSQTEAFVEWYGCHYQQLDSFGDRAFPADGGSNDGVGPDARDDSDPIIPFVIARTARLASQVGFKGLTATFRVKGADRSYPDTVDVGGSRYMYVRDVAIPFEDGGTPLV